MRRASWLLARSAQSLVASAGATAPQAAASDMQQLTETSARAAAGAFGSVQSRWSHCSCSGDLSLPPPQKVLVEYAPAEVDTFIAFADAVEEEFDGIMVDGIEVDGLPHLFDIKLEDGQLVFSRAAESSSSYSGGSGLSLPDYSDLFERLRVAGLQAAAI